MKGSGASTAASGIQVWKGMEPALPMAPIIIRTKAAAARPVGLDARSRTCVSGAGQRSRAWPMPRIMQRSQTPPMMKALTAVRCGVGLAADGDHAEQRDQQPFPEEEQRHEVVGQDGAVGQGRGQEEVGVELADPGRCPSS